MWSEGKRRRQLQKDIGVRTSFHSCFLFSLSLFFFLKGFVRQAASGDVSVGVVGVSTSGSLIFICFFVFLNMGEDHSLPFVSINRCFIMLFTHHVGAFFFSFLFVLFVFSWLYRESSWETRVVKCHRPWTVWIRGGGDLWPQSPSNIHIFTNLSTFAA